ncbi:FtsX-like permease family protein [Wukongibacter baidiensis]|uniref:ABC transporter permease n=1 Tax=Wukongibacter baidiensis TaxID=1723361 RepID=UPI003D7FA1D0
MKRLDLRLLRLIKNSKGQFIAVTVLVVVGLFVYTALSMAAVNLEDSINYYYDETNFADIYVQLVKIPESAIDELNNIKGVESVEGRIVFDIPLKVEDKDEKVNVRVISVPDKININSLYMRKGSGIQNKSRDVVVIEQFANARNIDIGSVVTPQIQGKIYNLNVRGIAASSEFIYIMENEQSLLPMPEKFGVIYVSNEFARQSFGYKDSFNEILVKVDGEENLNKIKKDVEKKLKRYGVKRIYIGDDQLSNRMVSEEIEGVKKSSSAVPLLFLGVAAIIIAAMLSRMIRNDRVAIGVLKALGYRNSSILLHYTKYSLAIGLIGSVFGILFGTILSGYIGNVYIQYYNIPMMKFKIYYNFIFSAILIASVFCIMAGVWGARNSIKILPAESMRPEPPKTGSRIFLDRLDILWKRLSFSWKMVLRNIFRNKKRFVFITLGIAMTFAIILLPTAQRDAFTTMFIDHYEEFQKMDYNINFNKPMNTRIINDLEHVINIDKIEPKIEYPFEIIYGNKEMVANIIGVNQYTEFYEFRDLQGQQVYLPKNGIVLSEGLAKFLGVSIGDKVKVKTFIPNKDDIYIEVKDITKQSLGINGYINIEEMRDKLTERELMTGVYLDSKDNVKEKLEKMENVFSIQSIEDMKSIFEKFLSLALSSIGVMIFFAGILGFVIVYNSTVMNISERSLQFASLRVMGFTKREIFKMITKENTVMTIMGIILGIPLGQYMLRSFEEIFSTEIYTLEIKTSFNSYFIAILLTIIFVILAQLATLKKINKLDFIEALKNRIS